MFFVEKVSNERADQKHSDAREDLHRSFFDHVDVGRAVPVSGEVGGMDGGGGGLFLVKKSFRNCLETLKKEGMRAGLPRTVLYGTVWGRRNQRRSPAHAQ